MSRYDAPMIDGIIAAFVVQGKIRRQPPFLPWSKVLGSALVLVGMLFGGLVIVYWIGG